eukprot:CAMPEP_0176488818 /NCGR_PEP_ID=MMETSP0200_2-20121128/6930_1 /TAXON_ID=947934 /ORGANISM="Chaetoceros sp., Strain GSL56" /LENGTH=308 /DNA_ID=CAMNT_0017885863 /DNA_START=606 /DNA_END=1529 /DNA_ORIENTATION=+
MFLEVAGKDILQTRASCGWTPFHVLIRKDLCIYQEEIELYIQYGGKELLYLKDVQGRNILHTAIECSKKPDIISLLIHLGGTKLVVDKDKNGLIPLDYFFLHLHWGYYRDLSGKESSLIQLFTLLIQTAGFDADAGGLFMSNEDCPLGVRLRMSMGRWMSVNDTVRWSLIYRMPCIAHNIVDIVSSIFQGEPFLQIAMKFVSKDQMLEIIQKIDGCMKIRDKNGRIPIEVAVKMDLAWCKGMKEILAATAEQDEHGRSKLIIACTYGFKWKNAGGVGRILNDCNIDDLLRIDSVSGLYPGLLLATTRW